MLLLPLMVCITIHKYLYRHLSCQAHNINFLAFVLVDSEQSKERLQEPTVNETLQDTEMMEDLGSEVELNYYSELTFQLV